jgi:hypothetical protein
VTVLFPAQKFPDVQHTPHCSVPPQSLGSAWVVSGFCDDASQRFLFAQLVGEQPHWVAMPPPPHVSGAVQVPHETVFPQPSFQSPHVVAPHPSGVQPHRDGSPPPPHVSGGVQLPQETFPPQPSLNDPHVAPPHPSGVHPHLFATPAPAQLSGSLQVPQARIFEQPSDSSPQFAPFEAQVAGWHGLSPQRLGPPPPQIPLDGHVPQFFNPPQPSGISPHSAPCDAHVTAGHPVLSALVSLPTSALAASPSMPESTWLAGASVLLLDEHAASDTIAIVTAFSASVRCMSP